MSLRCVLVIFCSFSLFGSRASDGAILTFNALTPADNATARTAWLAAIGISQPEHLVDFETGFSNGQNVSGVSELFPGSLVITDTGPGTPEAIIRSGAGIIGGSNPVGTFSLTHDAQAFLELSFASQHVDYFGFIGIDHTTTTGIVTFVGGSTATFTLETTGTSGNSGEFFGISRNDMPAISLIQLNAAGDGRWGIDSLEYGAVPEPSSLILWGAAMCWLRSPTSGSTSPILASELCRFGHIRAVVGHSWQAL